MRIAAGIWACVAWIIFASFSGEHKIDADPALALAVQQTPGAHGASLHASAKLNGGGPPLKLRTNSGTIRLQFLDSEVALRDSLILHAHGPGGTLRVTFACNVARESNLGRPCRRARRRP